MKPFNYRGRGFSLIEVMIAVAVLAFGLLSLGALQARLFQAGAESKARTTASALAQQAIEDVRAYPFATAPAGFTGSDYVGLASWDTPQKVTEGGVEFTVNRSISRHRPDGAVVVGTFDPSKPEFKVVHVTVSWMGAEGISKSVRLKSNLASLAPADAFNVIKASAATEKGPEVWIEPPNKDNPAVVPIAVGDGQSAASSNPIPRRFTKQDSNTAATIFSVHTFSGAPGGEEVLLNRKLDVGAVTCKCAGTSTSTASNPAFEPVVWNGKQLAYMAPRPLPSGTRIGTYSEGQNHKDIDEMCTVCCRDHHEAGSRLQRPDPYRLLTEVEKAGHEHYLNIAGAPAKIGSNQPYLEACQVIRVDGRSRLTIDPMQSMLVTVPMTADGRSQEVLGGGTFANLYSGLVDSYISSGVERVKSQAGYLSPHSRFQEFVESEYSNYDAILKPAPLVLSKPAQKSLVSFGLYVDYLSPETLKAYDCAKNSATNTADASCNGLRNRNPLATLPFYAINVANLGTWLSEKLEPYKDSGPKSYSVSSPVFANNTGILTDEVGGVVTAVGADDCTRISLEMTRGSSGVAGRLPIDPDDNGAENRNRDSLLFSGTKDGCQLVAP